MRNFLILGILLSNFAYSIGFLVPKDKKYGPFFIKSHRVEVLIKNGAAKTILREVFINPYNTDMEGIFVFPVPKDASVSSFKMKMKGKWIEGKVLERNKARNIYNRIVRQMKDPGLVEYINNKMFKASVYPIPKNGETEIEITYTQTTKLNGNIYHYYYPLKGLKKVNQNTVYYYCGRYYTDYIRERVVKCKDYSSYSSSLKTKEDFTFTAKIESEIPVKSVYSPSYKFNINKKEYSAVLGFEKNNVVLNKDIDIYYTVDSRKIGASILAYKPDKNKKGYFMLMISPKNKISEKEVENKNLIITVDTSGSMAGEKMKYAKEALKYIVKKLNKGDTFNIVKFSSGVSYYKDFPTEVNEKNIKGALTFIDEMESGGGTAIDEALKESLKQSKKGVSNMLIFITDGRPTVGQTDINTIVENSVKYNNNNVKVFSFGIGSDLNAVLIDKISNKNGGTSDYVKPGAEIEEVISSFYNKVAYPVLRDIKIKIKGIKVSDLYPYKIGDLFKGEDLRIFGRYETIKKNSLLKKVFTIEDEKAILILKGRKKGKEEVYEYNLNFKSYDNNDFIPSIWARKKVGFLLEEIRLNGENKELVEEVKRIALKYAIVTPYTSYLVTENNNEMTSSIPDTGVVRYRRRVKGKRSMGIGGGGFAFKSKAKNEVYRDRLSDDEVGLNSFNAAEGRSAVATSKKLSAMKKSDKATSRRGVKTIKGKTFVFKNGYWTDNDELKKAETINLKYMSDVYLKIISSNADLRKYFSIGKNLIVFYKGYKIVVSENYKGREKLPESLLK